MGFEELLAVIAVFGMLLIFSAGMYFLSFKILKKSLSYMKVYAKCVEIEEKERGLEHIAKMYCPVYEYEVDGRRIQASSGQFVPDCYEPIGSTRILYVNKKSPKSFEVKKPDTTIGYALLFMGTVFLITSIYAIWSMFFQG